MRRLVRLALYAGALCTSWFLIHTALTIWDGLNDEIHPADVAVILGNRVERNGMPSVVLRARLEKGLELYRQGTVQKIIVSGGMGSEGFDEADVMCGYLVARGVPSDNVSEDHGGEDTYLTAKNTRHLMQEHHWNSVVIVSDYYHIPRARLALTRFGIQNVYAAHSEPGFTVWQINSIVREFLAYYFYLIRNYSQT